MEKCPSETHCCLNSFSVECRKYFASFHALVHFAWTHLYFKCKPKNLKFLTLLKGGRSSLFHSLHRCFLPFVLSWSFLYLSEMGTWRWRESICNFSYEHRIAALENSFNFPHIDLSPFRHHSDVHTGNQTFRKSVIHTGNQAFRISVTQKGEESIPADIRPCLLRHYNVRKFEFIFSYQTCQWIEHRVFHLFSLPSNISLKWSFDASSVWWLDANSHHVARIRAPIR